MKSMYVLPMLALAAVLLVAFYKKWKKTHVIDLDIPVPTKLRDDLYYTYYGCEVGKDFDGNEQDQPTDTRGHVNLFWESQFRMEMTGANILKMAMPTVLDVTPQTMTRVEKSGRNFHYREDAPQLLRDLFRGLQQIGALKYVHAIYPMDEPNTNSTEADLQKAINTIRLVSKEFPELAGVKLVCIYAAKPETYECFKEFDYVGVDDYEQKSTIFANGGCYTKLKSRLLPHQKTVILPGGAFLQDPEPFVRFAHNNAEVAAIVAFCWFGRREAADNWIGIGNPVNGRKYQYIEAGRKICELNPVR